MKPNPSAAPADPVLLALLAAWLVAEALITLLVAAAAVILTLVGWRPAPAPVPPPSALPPPCPGWNCCGWWNCGPGPVLLGCIAWLDPAGGWSCCRPFDAALADLVGGSQNQQGLWRLPLNAPSLADTFMPTMRRRSLPILLLVAALSVGPAWSEEMAKGEAKPAPLNSSTTFNGNASQMKKTAKISNSAAIRRSLHNSSETQSGDSVSFKEINLADRLPSEKQASALSALANIVLAIFTGVLIWQNQYLVKAVIGAPKITMDVQIRRGNRVFLVLRNNSQGDVKNIALKATDNFPWINADIDGFNRLGIAKTELGVITAGSQLKFDAGFLDRQKIFSEGGSATITIQWKTQAGKTCRESLFMDTNALIGLSQASFADTVDICEALHELKISNEKIASVILSMKPDNIIKDISESRRKRTFDSKR